MKIRRLLLNESSWTRNCSAITSEGKKTTVDDPNACSFCLVGAAVRCYGENTKEFVSVLRQMRDYLVKEGLIDREMGVVGFNDNPRTTFADIRRLVETLDI